MRSHLYQTTLINHGQLDYEKETAFKYKYRYTGTTSATSIYEHHNRRAAMAQPRNFDAATVRRIRDAHERREKLKRELAKIPMHTDFAKELGVLRNTVRAIARGHTYKDIKGWIISRS